MPWTYEAISQYLQFRTTSSASGKKAKKIGAFRRTVLSFLLRDINSGGCPDNYELLSYVALDPAHFADVFDGVSESMVPVFLETFYRAVGFLREVLKGHEQYEEVRLVDAFTSTVATNLSNHRVETVEADVAGTSDCYRQMYHYAQVRDGEANGEGSCRCLVTKAIKR